MILNDLFLLKLTDDIRRFNIQRSKISIVNNEYGATYAPPCDGKLNDTTLDKLCRIQI